MEVEIINASEIAEKIETIRGRRWSRVAYLRLYSNLRTKIDE